MPVYLHNVQYLLSVVYQVRTCILSVKKLVSLSVCQYVSSKKDCKFVSLSVCFQ